MNSRMAKVPRQVVNRGDGGRDLVSVINRALEPPHKMQPLCDSVRQHVEALVAPADRLTLMQALGLETYQGAVRDPHGHPLAHRSDRLPLDHPDWSL